MTAPEQSGAPAESRSSVKLTLNAKREVQIEVKVYAGDTSAEVAEARRLAVQTFGATARELGQSYVGRFPDEEPKL